MYMSELFKVKKGKFFGPLIFPKKYQDSNGCYQMLYFCTAENREENEDITIDINEIINNYILTSKILSLFTEEDFRNNIKNLENPSENKIYTNDPYGLILNGIEVDILLFNGSIIAFGTKKAWFYIKGREVINDIECLKNKLMTEYLSSLLANLKYNYNKIVELCEVIEDNEMKTCLKEVSNVINGDLIESYIKGSKN